MKADYWDRFLSYSAIINYRVHGMITWWGTSRNGLFSRTINCLTEKLNTKSAQVRFLRNCFWGASAFIGVLTCLVLYLVYFQLGQRERDAVDWLVNNRAIMSVVAEDFQKLQTTASNSNTVAASVIITAGANKTDADIEAPTETKRGLQSYTALFDQLATDAVRKAIAIEETEALHVISLRLLSLAKGTTISISCEI